MGVWVRRLCPPGGKRHRGRAPLTTYRVVDVFAGAGGLSTGLSWAGFDVVLGIERDQDACASFAKAHPLANVMEVDARSVVWGLWNMDRTVIVGGPPCQPWSVGGKRLGTADGRDGWIEMLRAVRNERPVAFMAENVPALAGHHRFAEIVAEVEDIGYAVSSAVLDAADYGVAQHRRRLFIVGMLDAKFVFPAPRFGPGTDRPWRPAGTFVKAKPYGQANNSPVVYAKHPDVRPSPYAGHLWDGGGRPVDLSKPAPTMLASMGGNKTPWVDTKNIVPEYHAHLLAGGAPRSGTVPGARRITVDEAAALQSFPLGTTFSGSRSSQYRQVGNAVPPLLAMAVGAALLSQLP